MDTVVGDSKATAEWSKQIITPQDQTHVVESSDDLQIELLGAQALASVSLLFLSIHLFFQILFYVLMLSGVFLG